MPTRPQSPLDALGWDEGWQEELDALERDDVRPARVVRAMRRSVELGGLDADSHQARVPGRILRQGPEARPAVGDWVAARDRDGGHEVFAVLPRRSLFQRRAAGRSARVQLIAANVDRVLLVMGLDADFNLRRIERYLAVSAQSGAKAAVLLNKCDLAESLDEQVQQVEAIASGHPIVAMSAKHGDGIEQLAPYLIAGQTLALLGSSGVGKSTLVNQLLGRARQSTAEVRERDGRGRHTTTARELIPLDSGALLIDTPGMRELGLWNAEGGEAALDDTFDDVTGLAARCHYRDCSHGNEPGCAVRQALESGDLAEARLGSYAKLRRELGDVARQMREKEERFKRIAKDKRRKS
jgi:ribosome biogenesis GTPase / thiamine phosphate phosphatase